MGNLSSLASALTEGVKVNATWRALRDGRTMWCKRRRQIGRPILAGANLFFGLAQAPIRALGTAAEWQEWEVSSFTLLHGEEGFHAFAEGTTDVGEEEMPGTNLTDFLDGGRMTPVMSAAAGRELRRTHGLFSAYFDGGWSHGDAHAGNFIYDEASDRARLIDFELRHRRALTTEERQFDDVLGFLLDMVGRIEEERWLACAHGFLDGYGCEKMQAAVADRARIERTGIEGLWLRVRTTFLKREILRRRWTMLRPRAVARNAPREAEMAGGGY
jgi:hypothetical protein